MSAITQQTLFAAGSGGIAADGINRIPTMSSGTTSGVTVSASDTQTGYDAWKATDGAPVNALSSDWATNNTVTAAQLTVDFGSGNDKVIQSYDVAASASVTGSLWNYAPSAWTLQWSDDGSSWNTIDTRSSQTGWTAGEERHFSIANQTAHRYWRVNVSASNSTLIDIGQVKLNT